jgi:hypothetical protein
VRPLMKTSMSSMKSTTIGRVNSTILSAK